MEELSPRMHASGWLGFEVRMGRPWRPHPFRIGLLSLGLSILGKGRVCLLCRQSWSRSPPGVGFSCTSPLLPLRWWEAGRVENVHLTQLQWERAPPAVRFREEWAGET
jgi:hypothetical protein